MARAFIVITKELGVKSTQHNLYVQIHPWQMSASAIQDQNGISRLSELFLSNSALTLKTEFIHYSLKATERLNRFDNIHTKVKQKHYCCAGWQIRKSIEKHCKREKSRTTNMKFTKLNIVSKIVFIHKKKKEMGKREQGWTVRLVMKAWNLAGCIRTVGLQKYSFPTQQ